MEEETLFFQFERDLPKDALPTSERPTVCKHWINGRCKMGKDCVYLHVYDRSKMPRCQFYYETGMCNRPECCFLHVHKEDHVKECPWYNRGFCKHGPRCRLRHVWRRACPDFLAGVCLKGGKCELAHPSFDVPREES